MPKPPKILISDPDVVSELLRKSIQEGVDLHDEEFFWALVDTFADQPDYLQGLDINKRFEQFRSLSILKHVSDADTAADLFQNFPGINMRKQNPLSVLLSQNHSDALRELFLSHPGIWDSSDSLSPYEVAIHADDMLHAMLACEDIDPNTPDRGGLTLLQTACVLHNQPAMQLLMQHPRINLMESLTQGNKKGMLSFYGGHLIAAAADISLDATTRSKSF